MSLKLFRCLLRQFSNITGQGLDKSTKISSAGIVGKPQFLFYSQLKLKQFLNIVIGDEILKGEIADTNSTFLAKELHRLGLQLKKVW